MSEKLVCPYCERSFDLDEVEGADLWRERAEIAAKLGPAWGLANEYLEAFRSSRGARLSNRKRIRLLAEIARFWEFGRFEFDGRRYKIGQGEILKGLQSVCNADKTGFQNHNYLKKVLVAGAEKLSAEGLTAGEEEAREARRRTHGGPSVAKAMEGREEGFLSAEELARRAREFTKLINGLED